MVADPVVQESMKMSPTVAGLAAFGCAFGGMIFGSLVGDIFGRGFRGPIPGLALSEETPR